MISRRRMQKKARLPQEPGRRKRSRGAPKGTSDEIEARAHKRHEEQTRRTATWPRGARRHKIDGFTQDTYT
jgi:hypothetical protein